jgi:hypothetical protein
VLVVDEAGAVVVGVVVVGSVLGVRLAGAGT